MPECKLYLSIEWPERFVIGRKPSEVISLEIVEPISFSEEFMEIVWRAFWSADCAAFINALFSSEFSKSIERAVSATWPLIWQPMSTFRSPRAV